MAITITRFFNDAGCDFVPVWDFDPMKRVGLRGKKPRTFQRTRLNIQSLNAARNESRVNFPHEGVVALSETCATQVAIDKAKKLATKCKRHAFHSKPSGYRQYAQGTKSEARGEATGVWAAASCHAKPPQLQWPEDVWNMARACDAVV